MLTIPQPKMTDIDAEHFVQRVEAYPPTKLLSDGDGQNARLLVEDASTGFFNGRQFRTFIELNIPAGGTHWAKITAGTNFELHDQRISLISGSVRWSAVAAPSSSPGPWAAIPSSAFRPRNQMSDRPSPFYVSAQTIETSSTEAAAVGGFEVDLMLVSAAGAGPQSASVVQSSGLRGLPAGVFHVKLVNASNEAAVGVYDWWWEERP